MVGPSTGHVAKWFGYTFYDVSLQFLILAGPAVIVKSSIVSRIHAWVMAGSHFGRRLSCRW
jgi:hypothetical protein